MKNLKRAFALTHNSLYSHSPRLGFHQAILLMFAQGFWFGLFYLWPMKIALTNNQVSPLIWLLYAIIPLLLVSHWLALIFNELRPNSIEKRLAKRVYRGQLDLQAGTCIKQSAIYAEFQAQYYLDDELDKNKEELHRYPLISSHPQWQVYDAIFTFEENHQTVQPLHRL